MDERCDNCRFFLQRQFSGTYCRRFPPSTSGNDRDFADFKGIRWPTVAHDEWCGEWRPVSATGDV